MANIRSSGAREKWGRNIRSVMKGKKYEKYKGSFRTVKRRGKYKVVFDLKSEQYKV